MKVLVLGGGISGERAVSLRSAEGVAAGLRGGGHEASVFDPADPAFNLAEKVALADAVFPILHGLGGEDGELQAELEGLGARFLGAGSRACRLAFHKPDYKDLLVSKGVLTPPWRVVDKNSFLSSELIKKSYVLKPVSGGSSIDTYIVRRPSDGLPDGVDEAFARHSEMLLEELIAGTEITVGVLGGEALPIIAIIPPEGEEFSFENKYNNRATETLADHLLSPEIAREARKLAELIHSFIGMRHLSRTDMIITPQGAIYTLETNAIPGMTPESLYPRAALAAGLDMTALTQGLLDLTLAIG